MCRTVRNLATDEEIEHPPQLRALTGLPLVVSSAYTRIDDTSCLCQVDVKACLDAAGIAYEFDGMEYIISLPAPAK